MISDASEADYYGNQATKFWKHNLNDGILGTVENVTAIINESMLYASKSYVDDHINNASNPHHVTAAQAGAAPTSHSHAFSTITDRPTSYPPSSHSHAFSAITDRPTSYPPSHDCRPAKIDIGSSAAGYTTADCDYLCDGTDDQAEINSAITALPTAGGRILLLDGAYNITANITIGKVNAELCGTGGTKLTFSNNSYIKIAADSCSVHGMALAGVQTSTSRRSSWRRGAQRRKSMVCGCLREKSSLIPAQIPSSGETSLVKATGITGAYG
jgi:hypothetical protein